MSSMDALQPTGLARRAIARMLRVPAVLALLICFWPQSGLARQDEFHCDECQPHDDCLTSPLPHTWGCYSSYDWECQVLSDGLPKPVVPEFSHAALVPTGPYQGKVLLWRNGNGSTNNNPTAETWMFDPNDPAKLRVIVQSLDSNIFCGDMSWSPTGWLIVAGGGREISMDEYANETYLFIPTLIGSPVLSGSCLPTLLNGSPWRTLGDMSIDRYYPTLITTLAGDIRTNIGNPAIPIPGGAAFVIGGEYDSPSHGHGSDWWQLLPPGAPDWSHTLRVEANNDGIPCGGAAPQPACPSVDERYVRRSVGTEPLPDPVIEYYPRALQLATIDEGELGTVKNILLANDVETGIRTGCSNASPQYCNDPGLSWIIKPRYDPSQGQWELWRGPLDDDLPDSLGNGNGRERFYGTAVLRHDLFFENRVLLFGGQYIDPVTGYEEWRGVEEFVVAAPQVEPERGEWVHKYNLTSGRYFNNAVILPTGRVLVIGGAYDTCKPATGPAGRPIPACCPELYEPGDGLTIQPFSWVLAARKNDAATETYQGSPRLYHNVALLLPDGRVLNAGGTNGFKCDNTTTYPESEYTGEIFAPPYFHDPTRPTIVAVGQSDVDFGSSFAVTVSYPDGYDSNRQVDRFVLVRPAAVTHHFDGEQRYIELESTPTLLAGDLQSFNVTAPDDDLGPPGYYMLFAIRPAPAGVPAPRDRLPSTMAHFIRLK